MTTTKKARKLLERMAEIEEMERGKICPMKGDRFNHQTWQAGRNVVQYVPRDEVPDLQRAIDGYNRFMDLAQKYADEIIKGTRRKRAKVAKRRKNKRLDEEPSDKTGL